MNFLLILAQVAGIVVLADFVAGFIHWLEDAYGHEDTPVLGPLVIRPNIVHHHHPRFFTHFTWLQSSWDLLLLGAATLGIAWACDALSWQLWLFVAISVNANEVHKWSHRTRAENGRVISALQDWRILQTPRQHAVHHTDPKNTYYCPITNVVNPILERLRFWQGLEAIIERVTGVKHREDTSVRGQGPGPAWLAEYRPVRPVDARAPRLSPAPTAPLPAHASTQAKANGKPCSRKTCQNCSGCKAQHGHTKPEWRKEGAHR